MTTSAFTQRTVSCLRCKALCSKQITVVALSYGGRDENLGGLNGCSIQSKAAEKSEVSRAKASKSQFEGMFLQELGCI